MSTVMTILAVAAFILTIVSMVGKAPLSVPVILLAILACLDHLPLGK